MNDQSTYLFSGYLGRVKVEGYRLEKKLQFDNRCITVRVVDACNTEMTTEELFDRDSVVVDPIDNEYLEYCKIIVAGNNKHAHHTEYYNRAILEYPELVDPKLKTKIYHNIIQRMCPVDIFFNVCNYFQFMYETFNVIGVNSRSHLLCVANFPGDNAQWMDQYVVFGCGSVELYPLATIDVIGHELSHGIVESRAGLEYRGETGALNEAFADIFGVLFEAYMYNRFEEFYHYRPEEWFIGSNLVKCSSKNSLRSMIDPHNSYIPQPKSINDKYYIDPQSNYDMGGVHINSGIINHCFYRILSENNTIEATRMFYTCLCLLRPKSGFKKFAKALIASARKTKNRKLQSSVLHALDNAGLGKSNCGCI